MMFLKDYKKDLKNDESYKKALKNRGSDENIIEVLVKY